MPNGKINCRPEKHYVRILFIIMAAVYALPFLLSLSLPFAYWDWLMTNYYQLRGMAYEWTNLLGNIHFTFFQDTIQFRPLSAIIVNLQYLIFRDEFWLWYLFKWIVLIACTYFVFMSVRLLTRSPLAAFAAGIYFALQPMPLVLDVISQDAYVVLFGAAALCWLGRTRNDSDDTNQYLTRMSNRDFTVFFVLCCAVAFSKEISITYLGALLVLFVCGGDIRPTLKLAVRYALLCGLLVFVLFRIVHVNHPTSHIDMLFAGDFAGFFLHTLEYSQRECSFLLPNSAAQSLLVVSVGLISCGVVAVLVRRRDLLPVLLFAGSGLAVSIFVIGTNFTCPKYLPVPVMFLALVLGVSVAALEFVFASVARLFGLAFVVLMCLSAPPKIYSQWLGMMQSLYEMADIINFMETKNTEGFALRSTGLVGPSEMPWEKAATFQEFFKNSSVRHYGYNRPIEFSTLKEAGVPNSGRFVLVTSYKPAEIAKGALASVGIDSLAGVAAVFVFERERYGVFETVTGGLKRMDQALGIDLQDPMDCQPPRPSRFAPGFPNPNFPLGYFPLNAGPHLLYVFDLRRQVGEPVQDIVPTALPAVRRYGAFAR